MREYSSGKHPPLQRLHVSSLSDVYRNLHWAKHNSTSFIVHKSSAGGGHGGGAPEKVTVSCTELREEPNEKMRRVVRGEAVPTPEVMSWINFKVALGGPMSEEQLTLMRRTDRSPYAFSREKSYTYLSDHSGQRLLTRWYCSVRKCMPLSSARQSTLTACHPSPGPGIGPRGTIPIS